MPYAIPTFESLRANYLRDVRNLDPQAHVDGDSDNFIRGSAVSSAVHGLYHHQNWIARQVLPSTADPETLEQHAALRGMRLKEATRADGKVTLSPTAADVPAFGPGLALTWTYADETTGETAAIPLATTQGWNGGPAPEGGIVLACEAVNAGAMPALTDAPVTVRSAPEGIASQATATLYGGSDRETHAELLARLSWRMQNPPSGGTKADYITWCMEIPGIVWAACHPVRRGPGTVDMVVLAANGIPGPALLAEVQSHVDNKRPVTCPDARVFAPVVSLVNITAKARLVAASGQTFPTIKPKAEAELDSRYFDGLYPGDPFLVSRASAVLIGVPGMADIAVTTPSANIEGHALTWIRRGTLTLEVM